MGVTIHYRGNLDNLTQIDMFIVEMSDICASMNWPYEIMDEDWNIPSSLEVDYEEEGVSLRGHAGLKGVAFTPHEDCDPIRLTFDHQGQLNSLMNLAFGTYDELDGAPWVFSKTQYAGPDTHISVIKLLKYLKKKYISNLEVRDEGNYWETGNPGDVNHRMHIIDSAMSALHESLAGLGDLDQLSEEIIMQKIEEVINQLGEQEGIQIKVLRVDHLLDELDEAQSEWEGPYQDLGPQEAYFAPPLSDSAGLSDEELSLIFDFERDNQEDKEFDAFDERDSWEDDEDWEDDLDI